MFKRASPGAAAFFLGYQSLNGRGFSEVTQRQLEIHISFQEIGAENGDKLKVDFSKSPVKCCNAGPYWVMGRRSIDSNKELGIEHSIQMRSYQGLN